tara:strand:+ start:5382 stop:6098 length:717 start_codon:yes stop_codon:yes gene_type:complete
MTTKILTPKGIAHYPYISKPDEGREYSDGKYKVNLSIPAEEAQPIIEQINAVLLAGIKAEKDKNPNKKIKSAPIPYSNEVDEDGNETGNVIIKFKSKYKPSVVDAKNNLMVDHNIYGGSVLRVGGVVSFYNSAIGCGVTIRLGAVQIIEYVEGSAGGNFGFGEEEGFTFSSNESTDTPEEVDISVNVPAAAAEVAPTKPKAKPKAKPVPVEEPAPVAVAKEGTSLADEIANLIGETDD